MDSNSWNLEKVLLLKCLSQAEELIAFSVVVVACKLSKALGSISIYTIGSGSRYQGPIREHLSPVSSKEPVPILGESMQARISYCSSSTSMHTHANILYILALH